MTVQCQNRVPFAIADIVTLRERILQIEAQLQSAEQHQKSEGEPGLETTPQPSQVSSAVEGAPVSDAARKRRRTTEASGAPVDSQVSPPPSFRLVDAPPQPYSQPQVTTTTLTAESKALKRQYNELMHQWEQFASETAEQSSPHQHLQHSFSSTHLNVRHCCLVCICMRSETQLVLTSS